VREAYLAQGRKLPSWFTRPEVAEILAESYPPSFRRGICIWITGLGSSGKTTIANILTVLLQARGRQVSLLEGNVVRAEINAELGFSAEDRDTNNLRMAYFASEVVRHGGIAICTAISPYRSTRNAIRNQFNPDAFIEVFADAPIEVCEARDSKGLYAKARRGELTHFTGITDPYEPPQQPEIHLHTAHNIPSLNAQIILDYLSKHRFVR
jgi:sulfate adenylyltransferase